MTCDPVFTAKTDKLKLAKAEAEREIKAYKAQREEQYQKRLADVRTSTFLEFALVSHLGQKVFLHALYCCICVGRAYYCASFPSGDYVSNT